MGFRGEGSEAESGHGRTLRAKSRTMRATDAYLTVGRRTLRIATPTRGKDPALKQTTGETSGRQPSAIDPVQAAARVPMYNECQLEGS